MISFVVFVFGLVIGSFLNVLIYRMGAAHSSGRASPSTAGRENVLRGRSYCPQCQHPLAWHDLIPLVSFVALRGRCRYCKEKISFQYPFVELATGIVFLAVFNVAEVSLLAYLWAVASAFIVIFVYDLKHYVIPDKILVPAIGLVLLWRVFEQFEFGILSLFRILALSEAEGSDFGFWIFIPLVASLLVGLGAGLLFFLIYALSQRRAMGFGDVKLAFLLGLFLGWPSTIVALFLAFFLGGGWGLVLIALKKKGLKSEVPFAPFLIAGTAIAFFFGPGIVHWYLGLFLV